MDFAPVLHIPTKPNVTISIMLFRIPEWEWIHHRYRSYAKYEDIDHKAHVDELSHHYLNRFNKNVIRMSHTTGLT